MKKNKTQKSKSKLTKRKIQKTKNKSNPFNNIMPGGVFGIPNNPKKAFELGVMFGKYYIYQLVKDDNPLDGDQNDLNQAKLYLEDILKKPEMIQALNEIKNSDISKLKSYDSFGLGRLLGEKKAIEFVLSNNFNRELVRNQWFIVADQIENLE